MFSISLGLSLHKSVKILSKTRLLKHPRYLQMIQIGVSVDEKHESEYTVTNNILSVTIYYTMIIYYTVTDNILSYKSCETEI